MQNPEGLTPAERELQEALSGLKPAGTAIDRHRLMFQAGKVAARRRSRFWQGSTALLVVVLGWFVMSRPAPKQSVPQQLERIVYVDGDRAEAPRSPPAVATLEWRVQDRWHELRLD